MREARCALVVDFASRLSRQPDHLDAERASLLRRGRAHLARRRIRSCRRAPTSRPPTARRASIPCCGSSTAARTCRRGSRSIRRASRAHDRAARLRDAARSRAAPRQPVPRLRAGRRRTSSASSRGLRAAHRRPAARRAGRHRAARRPPGHRLSRRRRRRAVLQGRRHREPVEEGLPARAHRRCAAVHRGARARPAAGGDQDDRHPDALGDGAHRRAGAHERQPAARRAVLRRARPASARPSSRRRSRSSSSATSARTSAST